MSRADSFAGLDRYTTMEDIARNVRRILTRINGPLIVLSGLSAGYLIASGRPGAIGLVLMTIGTLICLNVWRQQGIGLPMVPMLVVQHLVAYGLPIVIGHETVLEYPEDYTTRAGLEVMIFCLAMGGGFSAAMQIFHKSPPIARALDDKSTRGTKGLGRLGFALIITATSYQIFDSLGIMGFVYGLLPSGTYSIFIAMVAATSVCGFFLSSMVIGSPETGTTTRVLFWALLFINCLISASSFLLSATIGMVFSVAIGLFWGSGRLPLRYLGIAVGILAFLNLGKFDMRERYWNASFREEGPPPSDFDSLGGHYFEWIEASLSKIGINEAPAVESFSSRAPKKGGQSLAERVNNLQNLLYVLDVMDGGKVEPLMGRTYALIPALLVPRILWPEKPRTHEGQVLLATHFGRQDLASTFQTYIAWGLLPEAYGNFGPIAGSLILGGVLGLLCGWVENMTARKPVLSTEGFVAFIIFLGMVSSFEMVSTVLVTSIFQSAIPVIVASLPFTRQQVMQRPEIDESISEADAEQPPTLSS